MIDAKEARRKSVERLDEIVSKQLEICEAGILSAIENGDFNFQYEGILKGETVKQLGDMGYNVDDGFIEWQFIDNEEDPADTTEPEVACNVIDSDEEECEVTKTAVNEEPETENFFDEEEEKTEVAPATEETQEVKSEIAAETVVGTETSETATESATTDFVFVSNNAE